MTSSSACEKKWSEYVFIHSTKRSRLGTQKTQDLVFIHTNLCLLSRQQLEYQTGPTRMWDYGDSQDDGDEELPVEVLQDNAEDMLDNTGQPTDQRSGFGIGLGLATILENEPENLDD